MTNQQDVLAIILNSDLIVKIVIISLIVASICSWAIILKKWSNNRGYRKKDKEFLKLYKETSKLNDIFLQTKDTSFSPLLILFRKGYGEFLRQREVLAKDNSLKDNSLKDNSIILGSIERAQSSAINDANERLDYLLSILASIGSICPFIGLFGTVWGIINSFRGLTAGGTTIDAVAPGIAEALVATAMGLAAAIPAVFFYNFFSNTNVRMNMKMESFSKEFTNMVGRIFSRK